MHPNHTLIKLLKCTHGFIVELNGNEFKFIWISVLVKRYYGFLSEEKHSHSNCHPLFAQSQSQSQWMTINSLFGHRKSYESKWHFKIINFVTKKEFRSFKAWNCTHFHVQNIIKRLWKSVSMACFHWVDLSQDVKK